VTEFQKAISSTITVRISSKQSVYRQQAAGKVVRSQKMAEIKSPPKESITRVRFAPKPDDEHVLASSWDGKVHVYNVQGDVDSLLTSLDSRDNESFPVLDATFTRSKAQLIATGLSKHLSIWDVNTGAEKKIGTSAWEQPVSCVEFHAGTNAAFCGSWDSTVKTFDVRMHKEQHSAKCESKIYCMDLQNDKVIVGMNNKNVAVFDVRKMSEPEFVRPSGLRYMLRSVKLFPNAKGFTASSVEGRVAWEYFDHSDPEAKPAKYAFKCHRETLDGKERIHPVNVVAFHPVYGTFATGGCDGVVSMWDGWAKKRLWRLGPYDTSVSSLGFSSSGEKLVIASSYTFENGENKSNVAPRILVRQLNDADCKPKNPRNID